MKSQQQNQQPVFNIKTCLVGIGNTLRADDGVGAYVCEQISLLVQADITVITTHQLNIGMAEDLSKFDRVIFIDASLDEKTFSFKPVMMENNPTQTFSHQINASMLAKLTQQLFFCPTAFYICAIGANDFKMGNGLSATTQSNADAAIALLAEWLQSNA
jgi:hydrogenase maturation protease